MADFKGYPNKGTTDDGHKTEMHLEPNAYYDGDVWDLVILTNGKFVLSLPLSDEMLAQIKEDWGWEPPKEDEENA